MTTGFLFFSNWYRARHWWGSAAWHGGCLHYKKFPPSFAHYRGASLMASPCQLDRLRCKVNAERRPWTPETVSIARHLTRWRHTANIPWWYVVMERLAVREVLHEVFGSDSESDETETVYPGLSGLKLVRRWLCPSHQENLLAAIAAEAWFDGSANQAMRFGGFPDWTEDLAEGIRTHFESEEIAGREPLFDQLIANKYEHGEGLTPHVDLMRFQDGIAIVSLQSAAVLSFSKGKGKLDVLLSPGDLLLLEGEARYEWKHGIDAVTSELRQERVVDCGQRISITLRKLV